MRGRGGVAGGGGGGGGGLGVGGGGGGDQGWRKSVAFQSAFSLSLQTPSGSFLVVSSDEAILSCLVVHALNS